jgi:hypothetical protein
MASISDPLREFLTLGTRTAKVAFTTGTTSGKGKTIAMFDATGSDA